MLTKRLEPIMTRIIDQTQAVFLPRRYILDNVVLSQEIIHFAIQSQQREVVVRIDFEKTYDKINWDYLLEVLETRNFGPTSINLISFEGNSFGKAMVTTRKNMLLLIGQPSA